MWGALTRIFSKGPNNIENLAEHSTSPQSSTSNTTTPEMEESAANKLAKQRASMKWLLSKAFNNRIPDNLKEPFYKDHDNQEHLKPQIIGALASAEIYCMALSNIYSDPNYHNMNHWSILQTLSRKGVYISEPSDAQLTETTLIQTNPLRMSAHMAVVESIMTLYAKEVVSSDRVLAAVRRFTYGRQESQFSPPETSEQGLFLWITNACDALKIRLEQDGLFNGDSGGNLPNGNINNSNGQTKKASLELPKLRELKDLGDGVALAALISYYCPDELPWNKLAVSYVPTVQQSVHNLSLVQEFCNRCLPITIFHLTPEDITYMRDSMRINLIVFLADLFNVIEIHPAKCVKYPGMDILKHHEGLPPRNEHGVVHKRNLIQMVMAPIPDLRSGLDDHVTTSASQGGKSSHVPLKKTASLQTDISEDSLRPHSSDEQFVIHRSRNIPTLRSVANDDSTLNRVKINSKDRSQYSSNDSELGAAGKPSNWEENRKSTFAGRRSRRNSVSDESQLTIENFGGSQDNINLIGRNPDKEVGVVHRNRKTSVPSFPADYQAAVAVRSSIQDARGSIQLGYEENGCDVNNEKEPMDHHHLSKLKRQLSSDDISLRHTRQSNKENLLLMAQQDTLDNCTNKMMGGDGTMGGTSNRMILDEYNRMQSPILNCERNTNSTNNNLTNIASPVNYINCNNLNNSSSSNNNNNMKSGGLEQQQRPTYSAPSNTTTWQQQCNNNMLATNNNNNHHQHNRQLNDIQNDFGSAMNNNSNNNMVINPSQLNDVRIKLEEKRRLIELEKRRMEMAMNKQRQKVGKAAFLQAVAKGKSNLSKTPVDTESKVNSVMDSERQNNISCEPDIPIKAQRPFTLQEIHDDTNAIEKRWLDNGSTPFMETRRTPELENMDFDQYQQSLAEMNSSLTEIQSDIRELANHQNQMQSVHQQQFVNMQPQKPIPILQQHYSPQQMYHNSQMHINQQQPLYGLPLNSAISVPHIPHNLQRQSQLIPEQPQFFLHDNKSNTPFNNNSNQQSIITNNSNYQNPMESSPPVPPPRRTWSQNLSTSSTPSIYQSPQQQPEYKTWNKYQSPSPIHLNNTSTNTNNSGGGGFILHEVNNVEPQRFSTPNNENYQFQNGGDRHSVNMSRHSNSSFTLSQQHLQQQQEQQYLTNSTSSPQHRTTVHRISQMLEDSGSNRQQTPVSLQQMDMTPIRKSSVTHAPIPAPSVDDMEPQSVSFIGNSEAERMNEGFNKLNITSGHRTYRIPSPTRSQLNRNSFQLSTSPSQNNYAHFGRDSNTTTPLLLNNNTNGCEKDVNNEKGFYIKFDDDQPKRPKPPLRTKRGSPKKDRLNNNNFHTTTTTNNSNNNSNNSFNDGNQPNSTSSSSPQPLLSSSSLTSSSNSEEAAAERREQELIIKRRILERELNEERLKKLDDGRNNNKRTMSRHSYLDPDQRDKIRAQDREMKQEQRRVAAASTIIIGSDLNNVDPVIADERERKKERIMMLSLQRRQELEEAKARKEQEAHTRREREKAKEDLKARKREEQAARRIAILEQYKLKKAMDEAEREGKVFDKSDFMHSLRPAPKMRPKAAGIRPRPKTIHIDSGSVEMAGDMMPSGRSKKGSTTNLTAMSSLKRDYYRGSHDSLADRSMNNGLMYNDSPDDNSRGAISPCHSTNQTLGRRSSYKTQSRDPSPAHVRGRSKYSNFQNFKGRKSNSMMNLYGSSADQDSIAYRYGDTDSGLGRATPPRRAPSPGMGRHLTSPSGPGSLPGFMTKGRRIFDDAASDISSTPSSMMDYTGPRLYKQPATKSNRGIILNAVEYCVFPGVVNRDAKKRVLDEINRSESKHFLILFRDAGCQFRALYSYCPERDEIAKLYGTGPKLVNDRMFDKFFKYNSGGKCFSQVHTKHLTVTIDAFTIHNSLWQGKKVNLPNKKDMALVI